MLTLLLLLLLGDAQTPPRPAAAQAKPPATQPAKPAPAQPAKPSPATPARPTFFTSSLPDADVRNKQAVVETTLGTIVIDLLPDAAPNHVGHFITRARERAYDGTTFHRVVTRGIIQGGDPLSKDPAQAARYGTGGLRTLRFEPNGEKHTRGAVSAVLVPGERDSGGAQFFICVTDQPALDGQFTVFGRVAEGMAVAEAISTTPAENGVPRDRMVITRVTIREKPAPVPEPFSTETIPELSQKRVRLETSLGPITVELFPDKAPNHVRQFLRLVSVGAYDGTAFHRVVPSFVIQGGFMPTRKAPLDEKQQAFVRKLPPEFNDTPHELGILSMARGDDPASADTSFFIVLDKAPSLDQKYTAFGKVVSGIEVVQKMASVVVDGETPRIRLEVTKAAIE